MVTAPATRRLVCHFMMNPFALESPFNCSGAFDMRCDGVARHQSRIQSGLLGRHGRYCRAMRRDVGKNHAGFLHSRALSRLGTAEALSLRFHASVVRHAEDARNGVRLHAGDAASNHAIAAARRHLVSHGPPWIVSMTGLHPRFANSPRSRSRRPPAPWRAASRVSTRYRLAWTVLCSCFPWVVCSRTPSRPGSHTSER